jgi:hypothetical protein
MELQKAVLVSLLTISSGFVTSLSQAQSTCTSDGDRIVCSVSESAANAVGPLHVPNGSKVVIRITNKSPFDDCTLAEVKLTEIKPSDPIVTILQLLTKAATGAAIPTGASALSTEIKGKGGQKLTGAEELHEDLMDFEAQLRKELTDVTKVIEDPGGLTSLAQDIDKLFLKPPRTSATYQTQIQQPDGPEDKLAKVLSQPDLSLDAEQVRYGILRDRLKQVITDGPIQGSNDIKTIRSDQEVLDTIAGELSALKSNYDSIAAAKVQFRTLLTILKQIDSSMSAGIDPFSKDLPMVAYRQQTATTSISCTNSITKKASVPPIPVTVMYEGRLNLSVSVGAMLSTIEKQKLGTTAVSTGTNSSGQPTFKSVFAVVDHAPVQVIPFAFLNYRLLNLEKKNPDPTRLPKYTLHASAGVGVNPNSGSNEVEFFFGLAFGIKKLLVQVGDHVGRFQEGFTGGFNIGDTVPANFPSTLPIHKVYRNGFGIALSYKLPL